MLPHQVDLNLTVFDEDFSWCHLNAVDRTIKNVAPWQMYKLINV